MWLSIVLCSLLVLLLFLFSAKFFSSFSIDFVFFNLILLLINCSICSHNVLYSLNLINRSTSGKDLIKSSLYLSTKQPVTIKHLQFCFLYSAISKIVLIASSLAGSIKPQVFITITSACCGSFTIS